MTTTVTHNGLMKTIGFYLRSDNFVEKLRLFAAKRIRKKIGMSAMYTLLQPMVVAVI